MFPQSFIDTIKDRVNMVDLAKKYTILNKGGNGVWVGKCPHPKHKDDTPSFRVWEKDNSWACMACHYGKKSNSVYGSDCIAFIQWIENISWRESVLFLAKYLNIPKPTEQNDALLKKKKMMAISYHNSIQCNIKAKNFLLNRGLDFEDIEKFMLGSSGSKIIFPLLDKYKNVLAFSKRWIEEPKNCNDKYRNDKNDTLFNKGSYFYGIHNYDKEHEYIKITEGPLDVILATKYKSKNVLATQGTAFTEEHAKYIKRLNKTPIIIYDNDDAGEKATKTALEILAKNNIFAKVYIIKEENDLCDLALKLKYNLEKEILDNSITYGQYKLNKIMTIYNSKMLEIKNNLYPEIIKLLDEIPNSTEKKILKGTIDHQLNIKI